MIPPLELMSKLELKSGDRLWLINAPREMAEELAAGAEVEMVHEDDDYDGVIAFVGSDAELEQLLPRIKADRVWISGADLTGDDWRSMGSIDFGDGSLQRFERA